MATPADKRRTGPGKQQQLPDGATLLFNFDIDSAVLKQEHTAFLSRNLLTAAAANPEGLRVVIGGTTDRLGDAGHNVALSNRRIQAVTAFLKGRMPRYPWEFVGFGQGVGEDTAKKAGDDDDTANEVFRAVIIEVLKPGQPIPPKPRIPRPAPRKETPFPKPDRPVACVSDANCPVSQSFEVKLVVGGTVGEGVEFGIFNFLIRDTRSGFTASYELRAVGVGIGVLPVGVSAGGDFKPLQTTLPVRVTRFGPFGGLTAIGVKASIASLNVMFRPDGLLIPREAFARIDTGPVTIPAAGLQRGTMTLQTRCGSSPGASRFPG